MFKKTTTARGFKKFLFTDYYDKQCSLQMSSAALKECIWLGIENAEPKILTRDAIKLGIIKEEDAPKNDLGEPCGWIEFPVPKEVMFSTRMHLTREQAEKLAGMLLYFAYSGEID